MDLSMHRYWLQLGVLASFMVRRYFFGQCHHSCELYSFS